MAEDHKVYLLRMTEAGRVVAEAPLIVYDKSVALRNFYEVLPQITAMVLPATISMIQAACAELSPSAPVVGVKIDGNHSGLQIAGSVPKVRTNGAGR